MPTDADQDSDDILERIRRLCWCAIYTRQTREPNDEYSSCQAQFDVCLDFVRSHFDDGWIFNGRRYDDQAESSETLDRPGLQKLLEHIRQGKMDRFVVHRLDRLSRRLRDCTEFLQELQDRRIPLTILKHPELGITADNNLLLNLMASFAEFEQLTSRSLIRSCSIACNKSSPPAAPVPVRGGLHRPAGRCAGSCTAASAVAR